MDIVANIKPFHIMLFFIFYYFKINLNFKLTLHRNIDSQQNFKNISVKKETLKY